MSGKAKLKKVTVSLPGISGEWGADESEQRAAWEMYVELVTRVSVVPLGRDDGLVREALTSLHAMFGETRRILREYGPESAMPAKKMSVSFGSLAVDVLNVWLRPFLSKWHPLLLDHEHRRPPSVSAAQHERDWKHGDELRTALDVLRGKLVRYANLLASVCGIEPLHRDS